jgi:single-strand selective monofunctional uracil DNA glycosylase
MMRDQSKELLVPDNSIVIADALVAAARELSDAVERLEFSPPVSHIYNPLTYAWAPHELYLRRFGGGRKRVIFVGMNPGPFGMVQCGVPFGEIEAVRGWMGIEAPVDIPATENPKRPIEGFACTRSEVSGRRLWSLFQQRFGTAAAFFTDHFVANYCPLAFFDGGRNLTPDKLPAAEAAPLYAACDVHLRALVGQLQPEWVIGIGGFAEARAVEALQGMGVRVGKVLHPSPASPAANRGWAEAATRQMLAQGIWD